MALVLEAFLTKASASVPLTLFLVESKVFLFFLEVFTQIVWCFSTRSEAKPRPQLEQGTRSSRGLEANSDWRGFEPPAEEGAGG